jgi:hypothetical protein
VKSSSPVRSLLGNSILTLGKSSAKQCDAVQFFALHFTRNRHVAVTFVLFEQYYATEGWFTLPLVVELIAGTSREPSNQYNGKPIAGT